jgi:hypothetical protein
MPRDNLNLFGPADIRLIRQQYAAGQLNVREWSAARACSAETIRRIARRETYWNVPDELSPPPGAVGTPALSPSFSHSHDRAEPSEDELATSLAKLSQAARELPPQRAEVNALLDDLAAGRKP